MMHILWAVCLLVASLLFPIYVHVNYEDTKKPDKEKKKWKKQQSKP